MQTTSPAPMMLGLVELLLEIFVVSQMSQLRLLSLWPCLSDPFLVPLAVPQLWRCKYPGSPQGSKIHIKFLGSNEQCNVRYRSTEHNMRLWGSAAQYQCSAVCYSYRF